MTFWSRGTACTEQQQLQEEATPAHTSARNPHISCKLPAGRRDQSQLGLGSCTRGIRISYEFALLSHHISHPLGMSHQGLHLPSPALPELLLSPSAQVQQHSLLPPLQQCQDAHRDPHGVPRDVPDHAGVPACTQGPTQCPRGCP